MNQKMPFRQFQQRPVIVQPRPSPKPKKTFRWWLVWLPLAIFLAIQLVAAVAAVVGRFSWDGLIEKISIRNKPAVSSLAALMCVCLAIVALAKILGFGKEKP